MTSRNKVSNISSVRRGFLIIAAAGMLCFQLCHAREAKGNIRIFHEHTKLVILPILYSNIFLVSFLITARKRSLRRSCFYTCLSFCPRGAGWYPSMPCRSTDPHPGGRLRGLAWGGSPGPHPGGEAGGSSLGGSPGPHPGGSWGVWPGGSPGPHLGGCISQDPAFTEADTPLPQQMATAAGGMHPTGMDSCLHHKFLGQRCYKFSEGYQISKIKFCLSRFIILDFKFLS